MAEVIERSILFQPEMIRAILAGTKTETRRLAKFQNTQMFPKLRLDSNNFQIGEYSTGNPETGIVLYAMMGACWNTVSKPLFCKYVPHNLPGSRLWVRETWGIFSTDGRSSVSIGYKARLPHGKTIHDTDGGLDVFRPEDSSIVEWAESRVDSEKWRSPLFMPRWASRITLEVTGLRVEKLIKITDDGARAEGVADRESYSALWDSINKGKDKWKYNPYVWVIQFRRV